MGDSVSYKDVGFLVRRSGNTIVGYSTQERGRTYVPDNGVPYPKGVKSVIERVMGIEDSEEELENLEILFNIISRKTPYEIFMRCIAILKGEAENGKRGVVDTGLLKRVLETEEKEEVPEPPKPEPPQLYHPKVEYEEPKKAKKTRKPEYPYLTEEDLNMPITNKEGHPPPYDLIVSIMNEIDELSRTIIKDPRTKKQRESNAKKQEKISELWRKRRSIQAPFEDGVFDQN
jgi:hypothetical protein